MDWCVSAPTVCVPPGEAETAHLGRLRTWVRPPFNERVEAWLTHGEDTLDMMMGC
jgi:hypothetical protein